MFNFLKVWIKNIERFWKNKNFQAKDKGILVFSNTSEVIAGERILKEEGVNVRVIGPPAEIRTGCDLGLEIELIEVPRCITHLKKRGLEPLDFFPFSTSLRPVNVFQVKDFGNFLMVRAANMKLTIDKHTLVIVNVSGGGCPDVPYLAFALVGKKITEISNPKKLSHTLCGYALGMAFEELKKKCLS
ncbi:Protein of unknown function [Desulfonauticus submarinus]|uniref:Uncharacterized protein n=1 Tax=Desulfonauticus submarinus TaxID=206665 RepID=A0A1H0BD58_9BACT|nr:DUF3343 domain-containing protein [Desulfonauticus submarinus]SDN43521.1 Protein of unknown function [Desulfonauticus submarinus]